MRHRFAIPLVCSLAAALLSCAGDGPAPQTSVSTFAILQRDIFDQSCTSGPCHNPQSVAGGLVLTQGRSFASLVGATPQNGAAQNQGWLRVTPFEVDASFLLRKIQGPGPGEGSRMPQGAAPLSASDIAFVRDWIAAGAPGPVAQSPSADPTQTPTATALPSTPTATGTPTTPTPVGTPSAPTATTPPDTPATTATATASASGTTQATPTPTDAAPSPTPAEPTRAPIITTQQIQDAILSPRCAVAFCHSGDFPSAGLNLEQGRSFDELVDVVPTTPVASGLFLVEPGNADDSFLFIKITDPTPAQGSRMPLTGAFLTEAYIALVRAWIETGIGNGEPGTGNREPGTGI